MDDLSLNETESRYFGDLFLCCDADKTGKVPVLKATELFRSANLSNDVIRQIISLSGIPHTASHVSRTQFYSCLKLIAAYQASIPLRPEVLSSPTINLPLPRFSWKDSPPSLNRNNLIGGGSIAAVSAVAATSLPSNSISLSSSLSTATNVVTTNDMNGLISTVASNSGSAANITSSSSHHYHQPSSHHHHHHHHHHHQQHQHRDPNTIREWREARSPDLIELSSNNTAEIQQDINNSDLQSTDSEVEQNESNDGRVNRRNRVGSPEAWSTNSDSPTPTNSVAERPWVKENLWQGILGGDEHRQLLGTEEESSDRHSSDDDNETDLEPLYQITPEQREYYHKQFKAVQPDPNGLLSGHIARVFFEKSRIPIEELRHIWQLCDVTRDGALSLAEFTAAMHLVVLRRNNIPLPSVLPPCLHPTVLNQQQVVHHQPTDPPEADLLHLEDDDKTDSPSISTSSITATTVTISNKSSKDNSSDYKRLMPVHHSDNKTVMNLSSLSTAAQANTVVKPQHMKISSSPVSGGVQNKNRSVSNSPSAPVEPSTPPNHRVKELSKDWTNQNREWTKFTESPTSNVSSPGPKPVNFDMQRTAQAVVSDPQILHPVPLRVTPVGAETVDDEHANRLQRRSETLIYDSTTGILRENDSSPKQSHHQQQQPQNTHHSTTSSSTQQHRESLPGSNDLRAIQRPQPKKLPTKNIGALPPPPQRESSFGSSGIVGGNDTVEALPTVPRKTEAPPLPPPRPHRHARSSSLDLNKLKMGGTPSQPEMVAQNSFEVQMDSTNSGFADFTHFSVDASKSMQSGEQIATSYIGNIDQHQQQQQSSSSSSSSSNVPPPSSTNTVRPTIPSQRVSAFEVYRKPNITPRGSQSPEQQQQTIVVSQSIPGSNLMSTSLSSGPEYEKRVAAIGETLRNVSFKHERNIIDVLRHLREQNVLLLRLCNDLSEELITIQHKKEEIRCKLESINSLGCASGAVAGGSGIGVGGGGGAAAGGSGNISTNVTGGSGSSGLHSNL